MFVVLRWVEVEAERGEVGAQRQVDHAGVRLCCPDERQQADHPKLVSYHTDGDVGHTPWGTEKTHKDSLDRNSYFYVAASWPVLCASHRQEEPESLSSAGCCC